jgi:hypothetical protein
MAETPVYHFRVTYTPGDQHAFVLPLTSTARFWLSDHVKGQRINNSVMVDIGEMLDLIASMQKSNMTLNWNKIS